ncbi:unnamed protein product [Sphagnum balticum]
MGRDCVLICIRYGYDPSLADGYDVRDWLAKDHKSIDSLLSRVKPVPDEWIKEAIVKAKTISVGKSVQCVKCESWKELTDAFRLAAKWTPELNGALAVALSCIASVKGVGEPLWTRIISPPSTYKSQLCKALGTNTNYTIMDDGMNGFYSGMDTGDGVDHSLVTKWMGNTLITKEGSTLFTNKRSEEIIGQARAIYDGEIDRRWNNGKQCSHRGWHGTWLLCGTPTMKDYDDNELGPRFIDYMIVKDIDEQLEDDILMRAMVEQNSSGIANENIESSDNPNYLRARQLCGGYIEYLRDIVDNGKIPLPELDRLQLIQIGSLAKFIERMRGRPSKVPTSENTGLALAARVAKQLVKLSKFLCIVTQVKVIDSTIMAIVYKVAMDTSDGWSHEIVKSLRESELEGDDGLEPESIAREYMPDNKLKGGVVPPTVSKSEPSEFDKFVVSNIDKVVITGPEGVAKDQGIAPPNPNVLELPAGISPQQAIQLQSAFKAIMEGKNLTTAQQVNPNPMTAVAAPPPNRDMIVPESNHRMWNPNQEFRPQTRLSDMENSISPGYVNPQQVIANAPINVKLNPKEGCSPVLIDIYILLKRLMDGRWVVPGGPKQDIESMMLRLQSEIEDK